MEYLVQLFQTLSAFLVLFYLYCESPAFQPLNTDWAHPRGKIRLFLVFTCITILGNYLGTPVVRGGALLNARGVGSTLAGLLGGPILGTLVGATAGLHRMTLGGAAAFAGAVATTLEGLGAGLVHVALKDKPQLLLTKRVAFLTVFVGEIVHMGIVLGLTHPFSAAVAIVKVIAPAMVLLNPVGAALLMAVLIHRQQDLDRVAAASSAAALRVAQRALGLMSRGFGPGMAAEIAAIVQEETGVGGVAVTDTGHILGFVGIGADHHRPGAEISSQLTRQAIASGAVVFADGDHQSYQCILAPVCPIHSALIVPLQVDGTVIGTVQLFEPRTRRFLSMNRKLGEGIGDLLSSQLLIARYQEQKNLLVLGELKLLQAQVNPHFLFNSLNTIMAVIRKDANRGRELVYHLSNYFRKNLKRSSPFSTLEEELEHIRAYLEIEKARFEGLVVEIDVPPELLHIQVPTFTLQPLLENAIKHGISEMLTPGIARIRAYEANGMVCIDVEDTAGAYEESGRAKDGLGLQIVEKRIRSLGVSSRLEIFCVPNELTRISISMPLIPPESPWPH
ncbi:MAG: LytS/YhcK type 5TM receptor domain-containing protein [Holophaga sp.]|nr:LytS/YhcK type 5TM receptor domain-containing protein [Holophaga sp.]